MKDRSHDEEMHAAFQREALYAMRLRDALVATAHKRAMDDGKPCWCWHDRYAYPHHNVLCKYCRAALVRPEETE